MLQVLTGFAVVVLVIGVGYALGRWEVLGPGAHRPLGLFVFYVATPALLFDKLTTTPPSEVFGPGFAVIVASSLTVGVLGYAMDRLMFRRDRSHSIIGALACSYSNGGNLGIPLAVYVLDQPAAVVPVILFQVAGYAPAALTLMDFVRGSAAGGGASGWARLRRVACTPLRNVMFLASMAGLVFSGVHLPVPAVVGGAGGDPRRGVGAVGARGFWDVARPDQGAAAW